MNNHEYYLTQLKKDLQNIEDLKQVRNKFFKTDRKTYNAITKQINDINSDIAAYAVYLDKSLINDSSILDELSIRGL